MKIFQVNTVCGTGSTGRITTDLYHTIHTLGDDCCIAYGRGSAPEEIITIKIGTSVDSMWHGLITRLTDRHGFGSKTATRRLIKKIREYDPDIIHLHNIHGYYINIEILFNYLKMADKPVIWTLHDCWSFTGHCSHFDYIGCKRWEKGCYCCPQKNMYPRSLFFDNSKRNYRRKKQLFASVKKMAIVTPSNWLAELASQSFLNIYPIECINNGINLDIFKPTASTKEEVTNIKKNYGCIDKYIILSVASIWEDRKGMKYLLELSRKLDQKSQLIIVGLNEKQKLSLPNNVMGIIRTNDVQQLAKIYTMADVFLNPTLEEVLGLTNLEALACGTPVITFKTGGSPECVDNTCGIVVERGSLEGLLQAIEEIKENPISRDACLKRAKLFNKDDKFLQYIELYNQMTHTPLI